jgi:hypothetical protein
LYDDNKTTKTTRPRRQQDEDDHKTTKTRRRRRQQDDDATIKQDQQVWIGNPNLVVGKNQTGIKGVQAEEWVCDRNTTPHTSG